MKFNRTLISLLLLLLIGVSQVSLSSLTIKTLKRNSKKHKITKNFSRKKATTKRPIITMAWDLAIGHIKSQLNELFPSSWADAKKRFIDMDEEDKKKKVLFFIIGIAGPFSEIGVDAMDELYKIIKKYMDLFLNCWGAVKDGIKMIYGEGESAQQSQAEIQKVNEKLDLASAEEKKDSATKYEQFCLETRRKIIKFIHDYKIGFHRIYHSGQEYVDQQINAIHVDSLPAKYCDEVPLHVKRLPGLASIKQLILDQFGSIDVFQDTCKEMTKVQLCKNYHPEPTVWEFLKGLTKYGELAKKSFDCIQGVLEHGKKGEEKEEEKNDFVALYEASKKLVVAIWKLGANGLLHSLSLGLWGAVKSSYYIVSCINDIYDLANSISDPAGTILEDMPYYLGRLIGKGLKAIWSAVFGRRRRLRRK